MSINTKNVNTNNGKISPILSYGIAEYKINSFDIVDSQSGQSFQIRANMEGRPIDDPNFTPMEGTQGKSGFVNFTSYINPTSSYYDKQEKFYLNKVDELAKALGVKDEVDAIAADSIKEHFSKIQHLFTGKWAYFVIGAEEYEGQDKEGKSVVKHRYVIPVYNFVSKDENALVFDKNKSYHYKKLVVQPDEQEDTNTSW